MTLSENIPRKLKEYLGDEKIHFFTKPRRFRPIGITIFYILFGSVFIAFTYSTPIKLIKILSGDEVTISYTSGSRKLKSDQYFFSENISKDNLDEYLSEVLFYFGLIMVFFLIGTGLICYGIYTFLKNPGFVVGTDRSLVIMRGDKFIRKDWELFLQKIKYKKNRNLGFFEFSLRPNNFRDSDDELEYKTFYLSGVENSDEIDVIIRERIAANHPSHPKE